MPVMARVDVVRPYVEKLLSDFVGVKEVAVDDDGDVPIRRGSTMYWVSLYSNADEAQVRVWSYMAREVPSSSGLFEHLNEINARIRYGRVYWDNEDVIVSHELLAEHLDGRELENACECIGGISDAHDDELVSRFGGRVFFPPQELSEPGGVVGPGEGDEVEV